MCHWINILYLVYILIIANCHCSMPVCFHCRASRAFVHMCIESFQGPCPGPLNKTIYTITCAFVSIHRCGPSAQAIPMLGVVILWQLVYIGPTLGTASFWAMNGTVLLLILHIYTGTKDTSSSNKGYWAKTWASNWPQKYVKTNVSWLLASIH